VRARDFTQQVVLRDLSQFSTIYLLPLADFHEGARDADHEISNGYIKWIADHNNAVTFLNGDMMNCLSADTEVLTDKGFRLYTNLIQGRGKPKIIATYNLKRNKLEYQPIQAFWHYHYKGKVIVVKGRGLDMVMTPEHRVLWGWQPSFKVGLAGQLKQSRGNYFPVACNWDGEETLPDDIFIKAGWVITEGWKEKDGRFAISQSQKSFYYQELLELLGKPNYVNQKTGVATWRFRDDTFRELFSIRRTTKYIPRQLLGGSQRQLKLLYITLLKGDGYKEKVFITTSRQLRDDFQELCLRIGKQATYSKVDRRRHKIQYVMSISHSAYRTAGSVKSEDYDGKVWDITVPNSFFVVRRNGKVCITGNCAWKDSTPELFEDLITPDTAYERLRARVLPIRHRILFITRGGHEGAIFRKVGADYMARLAYDLGDVPYKPDGAMFGIRLGKSNHTGMVWGYATHGWGGARTIGAKIKKGEDLANIANVDIIVVSHDHTQAIHRLNVLDPPRSKINFQRPMYWGIQRKLLINTGGFVKYAGYIQNKGYSPQDLGTPRIRIEFTNNKRLGWHIDLHASI
jgi:hypothetical protein